MSGGNRDPWGRRGSQHVQQTRVMWPASVRPSRAERTECQGYSSTFITVIMQNFWPITASNPSDYMDDIILAHCVDCPVWEVGQDSFLCAVLLKRLSYGHPHNLCRKYFTLQIVFLKIPSHNCSFYPHAAVDPPSPFLGANAIQLSKSSFTEIQSVRCRSVTEETDII